MNAVRVEYRFTPCRLKLYKEDIMDNQKTNSGSARDTGREGAGSSMGKDISKDTGSNRGQGGTGATGGTGSTGSSSASNMGTTGNSGASGNTTSSGSTSGSSVIDKAKDMTKDLPKSTDDMHKTIDKAAEAAQPVVDRLASTAHAGVDKMSGALAGASQTMEERSRQLADAASRFADTGREYVRSSPGTSILVAVGAGFILSKILGGRR
jgi:ElaB/YqjD/DUF883 family membrane-anchored ribosome-binding protein